MGSPPRMRGKLKDALNSGSLVGITPADAGKTRRQVRKRTDVQDHPRGCGENVNKFSADFKNIGSPPRMRGKRYRMKLCSMCDGITPADAGKTL